MTAFYFVEPTDSLFVRGNVAFGSTGEHGTGVMPPPPSLFAGAFRSAILGRDAAMLVSFTQNGKTGDDRLDRALGEIDPRNNAVIKTGTFRIAWLTLADFQATPDMAAEGQLLPAPQAIFSLPADLVRMEDAFAQLTPVDSNSLVVNGRELPLVAVLRTEKQAKPQGGVYLREAGWRKYLTGLLPDEKADSVRASQLYARDPRLGIGLNTDTRTAEPGLIYTTEGYAFGPKNDPAPGRESTPSIATGFLIGIDGADGLLSESGFLRLGGDGRGAHYRRVNYRPPAVPFDPILQDGRFRLILATPGLFSFQSPRPEGGPGVRAQGWLPNGITFEGNDYFLRAESFSARLVCAAVPRREIISGWDLFRWKPKDAQRAVPAGAVYWFEDFHGDHGKLAEWAASGLWGDDRDSQRRTEGFNNAMVAAWPREE